MNRLIAISCLLLSGLVAHSQEHELKPKELRKQRPAYIQLGIGANIGNMRDFATSPITYKGVLANYSLSLLKLDISIERRLALRFNHGAYNYKRTEGINTSSKSSQYLLFLNYYRLYKINSLSNKRWNVKVGGAADITTSVRYNPDLRNAGLGYELFNTISLSGKLTRRIKLSTRKTYKLWFIKHTVNPFIGLLSYRLNVPVMNNTIRNGFAYIANEGINTTPLFKEYQFKVFSGIRFSSELAYTHQMQNGNMWQIAYLWDAYAAGKDHMRFEAANHIIELSLLFHLNKNEQK